MINRILFHCIIIPFSKFPFVVLYAISDILFYVGFYIFRYRRNIVSSNIKNSFPNNSESEQYEIMKLFYKHFFDLIVESLKAFSISESEIKKRIIFHDLEIIDKFFDANIDIIATTGHYNNWEMVAVALGSGIKFTPVTLYKPLSNKYFDDKILKSRQRYGTQLRSMYNCSEIFKESKEKARAYIFATDQNPPKGTKTIWLNFLNQETSIFLGAEKYAKQYNLPVIFCKVRKVKRGFYEINLELLTENPNELADGEITKMHVKALENLIYENPQYWLWTHKRWKYKKEEVINNS